MTILVTGATGRLGRELVPRLADKGLRVRAMSRARRHGGPVEHVQADLATGAGLADAVTGVDTVVHLASAPYQRGYTKAVDVSGTRRLVSAAAGAGVRHVLYLSIVGIDAVPWGYFEDKLAAEQIVRSSQPPWTIVRATQFHGFLDEILSRLRWLPALVVDSGIAVQPVDVRDVADYLVRRLDGGPTLRTEEVAGPQTLSVEDVVRAWLAVTGRRRALVPIRLPGRLGRAFRAGGLTTTAPPAGRITWPEYLADHHT